MDGSVDFRGAVETAVAPCVPRGDGLRRRRGESVTAHEFRRLALGLPEASEAGHMGHPDFRVRGKIFATLGPQETWGMVKLTAEQQAAPLAPKRLVHSQEGD